MVESGLHEITPSYHKLSDNWTCWAHLPHDTDWTLSSYKTLLEFNEMEPLITLNEALPDKMIKNCMLFIMRTGIKPTWEDPKNRNGGCFSYKINNKLVCSAWKHLNYHLVGNTLTKNKTLLENITGITISPKKNFCIIKIWVSGCEVQNPEVVTKIEGLSSYGCLLKKHSPEY